jgi:hypothetical protein
MKKKAVSIEIDRPLFVLDDSLLAARPRAGRPGSAFTINRVRISHGELRFKGRAFQCQLLDFSLQSGNIVEEIAFHLDSPHLKATLAIDGQPVTLEGNLAAEARRHGSTWKLSTFTWKTRDITFNLNGRIQGDGTFQLSASAQGNPGSILRPLLDELTVRGLIYADARIARDARGKVQVTADVTAPACRVHESLCRDLSGQLRWDSQRRALNLEAWFDSELARSALRLESKDGETRIALQDVPAAALAGILEISDDAPLAGIIHRGDLEVSSGFIRGRVELDATPARPLSLPFVVKGSLQFQRDKAAHQTTFAGERLQLSAGDFSIEGTTNSRDHTTAIRIAADLRDMATVAPYAAHYLAIDLRPWKLSGGSGPFELRIDRRQGRKRIVSRVRLADFQANRQPIAALQGEVEHSAPAPATHGTFTISAAGLNTRAELAIADRHTTIHFRDVAGESRTITRVLGLEAAILSGPIAGEFTYRAGRALPGPELAGRFTAPRLAVMGNELAAVRGTLRSDLKGIDLRDLEFAYKGGRARASVLIDPVRKRFDLQGRINGIDAALLSRALSGRADIEIDGRGDFLKDPLTIAYRCRDMRYYADRPFSVSGTARILTDFSDVDLKTSGEVRHGNGASAFNADIARRRGRSEGSFTFNLTDLNQLIPWSDNDGSMRLLGQVGSGADGVMHGRGVAVFSGRTLSLPGFSHSLDDFQGTITFVDRSFSLQSLSGKIGGGQVEGSGQLAIDGAGLHGLTFTLKGKGLNLYPMDRTSCVVDPDLTLRYDDKKLLLSGTLNFPAVEWQREIDERIVFSTRSGLTTAESRIRDLLRLDIAMNSDNFRMHNSLGSILGRFKLRLTGTASFPVLNGTCEGRQGEIFLSQRPFTVLKAKLVFNNSLRIDPLIQIESEAFIQSYRIRFDIRGSTSRAKPELSASPPLPTQDILALVSLGEAFQRTGSTEISSQQGSTAMITSKLTEEIKNRANKLLGINLLRIDPVLSDQSALNTSRLTVGKTISKDLVVVYSTNLSTSRQEIVYIQYQLSPAISLIAMRNEEGRYSLDLRLRSRR